MEKENGQQQGGFHLQVSKKKLMSEHPGCDRRKCSSRGYLPHRDEGGKVDFVHIGDYYS